MTDGSGSVTATYKYDVFGALRSSSGTGSTEYRFTGQQNDASAGYTYLRARYYDPTTGRFISKDAFRGVDINPGTKHYYAYALNNPSNLVDPSGEFPPFDDWEQWVEGILNATASPAYAPVEDGNAGDLADLAAQSEACGTGRALPAIETAYQVTFAAAAIASLLFGVGEMLAAPRLVSAAEAGGSAARSVGAASTPFGRSVQSLKAFLNSNEGPWKLISAHGEQAIGGGYRGGTSIEEVFANQENGERIIRHTIVQGDKLLHETFRDYAKFGAD